MTATARRLPAEEGLWAFVTADMTVFALFFNIFVYYREQEPAVFRAGQSTLLTSFGLANTLILLTGSWFMVLALRAIRARARARAVWRLGSVVLCGGAFGVLKIVEYSTEIAAGHTPASDDFYMLYFMFTGIHFMHLIVGAAAILALLGLARQTDWNDGHIRYFEAGAIYWHMVDLLWVMLFPLFYLVR